LEQQVIALFSNEAGTRWVPFNMREFHSIESSLYTPENYLPWTGTRTCQRKACDIKSVWALGLSHVGIVRAHGQSVADESALQMRRMISPLPHGGAFRQGKFIWAGFILYVL